MEHYSVSWVSSVYTGGRHVTKLLFDFLLFISLVSVELLDQPKYLEGKKKNCPSGGLPGKSTEKQGKAVTQIEAVDFCIDKSF